MKIGGYTVGDYTVKEEGEKRHLIFDCKNCPYSASISDDEACRYHVISILQDVEANLVVLAEVYERIYNEDQTKMLIEISNLVQKFEVESVWSYKHLGTAGTECEKKFPDRHNIIVRIAHDLLAYDPIATYISCLKELKREQRQIEESSDSYKQCTRPYIQTLTYIKQKLEEAEMVKKSMNFINKLQDVSDTKQLYHSLFEVDLKPSFIGSRLMFGDSEQLSLLDEYAVKESNVQVFSHPDKTEKLYFINPPEYTLAPDKYFVLSKTREIVAGYQPGRTALSTVAKSRKYFERIYQSTIKDVAKENQIDITKDEISELAKIVARYTVGYGVLELLLSDRNITDIYLDSPIGQKPIYIVHADYGQCQTNIIYTLNEAESLISKIRAMSGRPFDEAHPVLDFDLQEFETRVALIGKPLAPEGAAFAFRLHKMSPWTMEQFIDIKYITPLAAGLLSFFIDQQATTLITGSRGSGKTSLLNASILEIPQNSRIIVQEDTLEIAVPYMKKIGFNIQRLKTRSPISVSKTETEVSAAEALRTALRLGDSALVLGEVRSTEAKVLYEAMRVGAAGNVVLGTIHGDSAYSVWDRVVNDLEVPNTSFKATDLVVVARPIRFAGSLTRNRRVVQMTEVKKHWVENPDAEGGLLDLMLYDAKKDKLELLEDNLKESELFEKIGRVSGLSMEQMWADIKMRAKAKAFLVSLKEKHALPVILEAENTSLANSKLLIIKEEQINEFGSVNYEEALGKWKYWVTNNLLKNLIVNKK
ncbi:MAG: type II/IV secretion system ATPase subunit [Candidatus Diapherotrites archaeon]